MSSLILKPGTTEKESCTDMTEQAITITEMSNRESIPMVSGPEFRKKLKPGKTKPFISKKQNTQDKIMALRASKSRSIKNLKKIAKNLQQKQIYEPVECLFIVYSKTKKMYKYFGTGHMVNHFEKGQPLAVGTDLKISRSSKDYSFYQKNKIKKDSFLTPNKYKFNFTEGAGKNLAKRQKEELENLVLSEKNAKLKQLFTAGSSSRSERGNSRRGRGRGAPTNVRGRGRGGKIRQRETICESEEDDHDDSMPFESRSERGKTSCTRRGRGRGARTNVRGRGRGGKTRRRETTSESEDDEHDEKMSFESGSERGNTSFTRRGRGRGRGARTNVRGRGRGGKTRRRETTSESEDDEHDEKMSFESGPHGQDPEEDEEQHPLNDLGPHGQDPEEDEEQHPLNDLGPHGQDPEEDEEQHPLNDLGPHGQDPEEDEEQHPLNDLGPHGQDPEEDEEQHPLNDLGPHGQDPEEDEEQHPLNDLGPHGQDPEEDEEQHPLNDLGPHGQDPEEDEEQHPLNDLGPHGQDPEEDEEQHPLNDLGPECQKKLFEDEDTVIDDSFHGSYQGYNSEDQLSPLYPLDSSLLSESSFLTALTSELMEVPGKDGIEVKNTHAFKIGNFLLVEFDLLKSSKKRKYIAEILELTKGETGEPLYKVKCLKRLEGNFFIWPEIPDICNIAETKILKKMDPPEKEQRRRSTKMFFPTLTEETC